MNALNSIAFIPDGNRRFAKKQNISLVEAYALGTKKAWQTLEWLKNLRELKFISFYSLSYENFKRKKNELKILSKVFEKELDNALDSNYFNKNKIKVKFIGRINEFSKKLVEKMNLIEEETAKNSKKILSLALGYDGRTEIIDAVKCFMKSKKKKLNEKIFSKYLYADIKDPDLIIRTSGTQRLSGFLLYQSSYSELFFSKKLWPEFDKSELNKAINFFKNTKRNFGR